MTDPGFTFKAAPQTRRPAESQGLEEHPLPHSSAETPIRQRRKRRTAAELEAAGLKSKPRAVGLPPDVLAIKECVKILRGLSAEDAQRVFVTLEALFK